VNLRRFIVSNFQNRLLRLTMTAWRCGGILCSFCRQLKPNKGIKFNGFYCSLIYNLKLELPINSELLLNAPTSCRHNAKPIVSCFASLS